MKLDVDVLRYLSKDDFRVLTAVELGMRNHEIVPTELIDRIARLKRGGTYKVLKNLLKNKLLHHDSSKYDGFRLTYLGYDFLAIKTMVNKGVFQAVGRQIGVGKESDIFEVACEDGTVLAMKLHRLGRVSFRAVKSKRDYLRHRSSYNWLYLSRLAALKEFAFMKALEEHGFPVPKAIEWNRHCVVMSLVQGYPLVQVKQLQNPEMVFETILNQVVRLAEHGLIHCDFNEFNIMIDDDERVTMIDFPQMVSVSHRNAQMYFDRDVECIFKFFRKRFNLSFQESTDDDEGPDEDGRPCFSAIDKSSGFLDRELAASGFTKKDEDDLERFIEGSEEMGTHSDDDGIELAEDFRETNVIGDDSLQLEQDEGNESKDGEENSEADQSSDSEKPDADDGEENNESVTQNDAELTKRLNKQRRRAIASARKGQKPVASRNCYKAKGSKSAHNSKIQKQLSGW
ncbi:serine/threonine-protein kinase rio2 [Prosopis cineraria]|uniref:serine/threonine-protein kinase rio2 n=1 Tax=Prosopis cineraria TaxID=364024 RepID=UPI00241083D7|nr:serine/threonine-protein kinase rio2 [Prosopis cineraria]XP_054793030.1 serine/threonine-protein kinase rio2 [Prosopis cineraria]